MGGEKGRESFFEGDPKKFELIDAAEHKVDNFEDTRQKVPRFQTLSRDPGIREIQRGTIVISELPNGDIKLHVRNSKGEVKSVTLT